MSQHTFQTPCPIGQTRVDTEPYGSFLLESNNTTANIDFTTEFRASLYNVKPRRRQTAIREGVKGKLGFVIHEDQELHVQKHSITKSGGVIVRDLSRRRTSIAQPPQRAKQNVVSLIPTENLNQQKPAVEASSNLLQAPRRPVFPLNATRASCAALKEETLSHIPSPKACKPARRGTIFIPSDDTTMPSIYMGVFSPLKTLDPQKSVQASGQQVEVTGLVAQIMRKKPARISILTASPRRVALHPVTKPLQETALQINHTGNPTGKENVPPGQIAVYKVARRPRMSMVQMKEDGLLNAPRDAGKEFKSRKTDTNVCISLKESTHNRDSRVASKPAWNAGPRLRPTKTDYFKTEPVIPTHESPKLQHQSISKSKAPSRLVIPSIKINTIEQSFPLIPEGIADASMYEQNWLANQEVALTQLLNSLFYIANSKGDTMKNAAYLRLRLSEFYGNSDMALLYRRIQSALLYGALSIPQDVLNQGDRLSHDLGKRKAFTDLWLQSYDNNILLAALEVITGRLISEEHSVGKKSCIGFSTSQQQLRKFIEVFLIGNEDGAKPQDKISILSWSYQRTILRSLMLIKLLDSVKTTPTIFNDNLFRYKSQYKTSESVVQALMQMLNPSAGDSMRALSHLGYSVNHYQYPLQEYKYEIDNLAIDLRDGIRLTRLVELLLYRSASQSLQLVQDGDGTTTVLPPSGETMAFEQGHLDWPLSQHLKIPCLGRAAKLYNVQVALSALKGVKGMEILLHDIRPEDIVDGFREKTVRLLWGLTSKWGLDGLIDWDDVKSEIKRLRRVTGYIGHEGDEWLDFEGQDQHMRFKGLLKSWAEAIASSRGLMIRNFNTSFADGKVFAAIVSEYEPYLACSKNLASLSLCDRLRKLGCSQQFAQIFSQANDSPNVQPIFDRDFVLASLAFLCSRLLAPSKPSRAATIIQRAWRKHWIKTEQTRKQQLRDVAQACANEVQHRKTLLQAKQKIWHAWCNYKGVQAEQVQLDLKCTQSQFRDGPQTERAQVEEEDIWLSL